MSADAAPDMIRSFVDRILRLKEEQDGIASDIRDVYAEAKALGFDKAALGQLVTYLRKLEKNPEAESERKAIFDLYLEAYQNAPRARTRMRVPAREGTELAGGNDDAAGEGAEASAPPSLGVSSQTAGGGRAAPAQTPSPAPFQFPDDRRARA